MRFRLAIYTLAVMSTVVPIAVSAQGRGGLGSAADSIKYKYAANPQLEKLKEDAVKGIDAKAKMIQEMVDQVFSFGELGMQEFETSKYLSGILEQNGFKVERGVAEMHLEEDIPGRVVDRPVHRGYCQ